MSLPTPPTGTPAGVGARLAAFSIDVVVIAAAAGVAWLVSSSLVLAAFVAAETVLALWIVQARWGLGPGTALLRLRVLRADAPYSPGAGRTFVRGSLVALGGLVFVAGAWIVQASAAWDRSERRRSWADIAAQTVVVKVPRRRRRGADAEGESYALATPTVLGRPSAQSGRPAAEPHPASAVPVAPVWGAPAPAIAAPAVAGPVVADPPLAPGVPAVSGVAASVPPAPVVPGAQLLLAFDTGQREQLALPTAVNLGRNPVATEPGDALIIVTDPDRLISKTHLRLEHDGETAWVTDAGSTNGSELVDDDGRGRVLAPGVRTRLDDGVRVRLGERVFTVSRLIGGTR